VLLGTHEQCAQKEVLAGGRRRGWKGEGSEEADAGKAALMVKGAG